MNLIPRIRALPQVLQDLIAEYNVEHRPRMSFVLREIAIRHDHAPRMRPIFTYIITAIRSKGWEECAECMNPVDPQDEYVYYVMNHRKVCCSDWCRYNSEWSARKQWRSGIRNDGIRNDGIRNAEIRNRK
jgi:hypothetical protein